MKRFMILALMAGLASPALAADPAPATMAAFTAACDDLTVGSTALEAHAKTAKLKAWSKTELARVRAINLPSADEDAKPVTLKSDLVRAWWFDADHVASVIYQEASDSAGQKWRSCVLSGRVANAAPMLKAMLAVQTRTSPDAWTNTDGKLLVVNFDKGASPGALPGSVMAQFETGLPFPDMNFILVKKDPQYAPHTPHPIAVTEAEVFDATAKAGTVAFKRESPVPK